MKKRIALVLLTTLTFCSACSPSVKPDDPIHENEVQEAKTAAIAELESYVSLSGYRDAEKAQVTAAIEAGKTAINSATTKDEVQTALASAKATIDAIKTAAQYEAEELAAAKTTAISALESYVSLDDYRDEEKELVKAAINEGKTNINAATSIAEVEKALSAAKTKIDAIKTRVEIEAEELASVKATAISTLESYVEKTNYYDDQVAEIDNILSEGKATIEAALNVSEVNAALAVFKGRLDGVLTKSQIDEIYIMMDITFDIYEIESWSAYNAKIVAKVGTPDNKFNEYELTYNGWTSYKGKIPQGATTIQFLRYSSDMSALWENTDVFSFDKNNADMMFHFGSSGQELIPFVEPDRTYFNIASIVQGDASWEGFCIAYHKSADGDDSTNDVFRSFYPNSEGKIAIPDKEGYDSFKIIRIPAPGQTVITWEWISSNWWGGMLEYALYDAEKPYFVITENNGASISGQFFKLDDSFTATITNTTPDYGSYVANVESLENLAPGTKVSVMVTPVEGYALKTVTINGTPIAAQDNLFSFIVKGNMSIEITFGPEVAQRLLTIDFSESTGIITGPGYEGLVAKFTTEDENNIIALNPITVNGQIGTVSVPDDATKIAIVRTPPFASDFVVTWEWICDSHFWGGNVSNTLSQTASTAKISTDYVLEYMPTTLNVVIDVEEMATGGERFGFYFYNKSSDDNEWVEGKLSGNVVSVSVPSGYTYFQMLRTSITDKALGWDCDNWGQIYEVALTGSSSTYNVTSLEGSSLVGGWIIE